MASRAVQLSVLQFSAGVLLGATIEAVLPSQTEGASLQTQVFEVLVQVGLNGVALSTFAGLVRGEGIDPTFGIPFAYALNMSQTELRKRLEKLSALVKAQVQVTTRRMALPAPTA